jgi:prepilin-type N-terminal cleavage/methylation domain-containing protein
MCNHFEELFMKTSKNNLAQKEGFTLIELSIVLVIIGLLVGGVLVGQDMIKAAELRALISQIEKYNTAINTFQNKYNAKPGDITAKAAGQAAQFGLSYETILGGNVGHGDGNGLIEGGAAGATNLVGETLYLWKHLGEANLVDGSYGIVGSSAPDSPDTTGTPSGAVTNVQQSLPASKLKPAGSIVVYSEASFNYYQVTPITGITTAGAYSFGGSGMTPVQAYNIDAKIDDGAPMTGTVLARALGNGAKASTPGLNQVPAAVDSGSANTVAGDDICMVSVNSVTPPTYSYNRFANHGGNDPSCSLRLRFN